MVAAKRKAKAPEGGTGTVEQRDPPRSPRGEKTRAALIAAARVVFEREGFLEARVSDITVEAGVASGTFYTYFDDKEQVFSAIVEEVEEDMLHPHLRERLGDGDAIALIEAANREYLRSYARNARLMALFEQVAQINKDFRELRRKRSRAFVKRNAELIGRLQEEGLVDAELDPYAAAHALSAMVGRSAFDVYVNGDKVGAELLADTLNRLWINALRLDRAAPPTGD